jgi:hypothetical protein
VKGEKMNNNWKEIDSAARRIADQTIKINDRISLVQMVSGSYRPAIDGNQTEPSELSGEDLNAIRSAFGIEQIHDDLGGLLTQPTSSELKKDKNKAGNPFDENPLIP